MDPSFNIFFRGKKSIAEAAVPVSAPPLTQLPRPQRTALLRSLPPLQIRPTPYIANRVADPHSFDPDPGF
jgi:hypothetical protein